jgi:hypothetical protein
MLVNSGGTAERVQQQQGNTNRASVASRCSMPTLSLIDNKPCIQIYVRVNTYEYG